MAGTVSRQAAALTKVRERRRALDADRDEQDCRVEQAMAEALVALETRGGAGPAGGEAALGETLFVKDVPADFLRPSAMRGRSGR